MSDDALQVQALEEWFFFYGHRLELELTAGDERRWVAIVLPAKAPMGSQSLLAAFGATKLEAARQGQSAFRAAAAEK